MGTINGVTKGNVFRFLANDDRLIVVTDKSHRLYDRRVELPLQDIMIESIADPNHGVITPIIVRRVGEKYEVIDGKQRVRAARAAQARYPDRVIRIPAITRTMKDYGCALTASVSNVQRTEDSIVTKGYNAARLIEMGAEGEELRSVFGVEPNTVHLWIRVVQEACEEVKDALEDGTITFTNALSICSKNREDQLAWLDKNKNNERGKPGPKKGQKRFKKINVTVNVDDNFAVDVKCSNEDLAVIIERLDDLYNARKRDFNV